MNEWLLLAWNWKEGRISSLNLVTFIWMLLEIQNISPHIFLYIYIRFDPRLWLLLFIKRSYTLSLSLSLDSFCNERTDCRKIYCQLVRCVSEWLDVLLNIELNRIASHRIERAFYFVDVFICFVHSFRRFRNDVDLVVEKKGLSEVNNVVSDFARHLNSSRSFTLIFPLDELPIICFDYRLRFPSETAFELENQQFIRSSVWFMSVSW